MKSDSRHQCVLYSGAPSLKLPSLAAAMQGMMMDGYRCLYLNSPAMVTGMRSCLSAMGVDVAMETTRTSLIFSSEPVCEGEYFDIDRMLQKLEDALDLALADGYKGLWASGDMTWELGSEKNFEKVLDYEWKLEALFQRRKELHGICQYHQDTLPHEVMRRGVLTHPALFVNETLSRLNPYHVKPELPFEGMTNAILIDKMIAELCETNSKQNDT